MPAEETDLLELAELTEASAAVVVLNMTDIGGWIDSLI